MSSSDIISSSTCKSLLDSTFFLSFALFILSLILSILLLAIYLGLALAAIVGFLEAFYLLLGSGVFLDLSLALGLLSFFDSGEEASVELVELASSSSVFGIGTSPNVFVFYSSA